MNILGTVQDIVASLPWVTTAPGDMLTGYYPVLLLLSLGLLCTLMAKTYMDNPKQMAYRLTVLLGLVLAPILAIYCVVQYTIGDWSNVAIAFIGVAAFTLALRPALRWNIAFALSVLVALLVYYGLYLFIPGVLEFSGISGLILLTVAVAVLAYHLFSLAEAGLEFVAGLLNAWPILMVIGVIAMAEGVAVLMGMTLLGLV